MINDYTVQVTDEFIGNDEPINVTFEKADYDTLWGYEDAQVNQSCKFPANVFYLLPGQSDLPDSDNYWVPEDESYLHDFDVTTQVYFTPHEEADRAVVTVSLFNGMSTNIIRITFNRVSA